MIFQKEMPLMVNGVDATIDYCMYMVMVDIKNYVVANNIGPIFNVQYIITEKFVGRIQYIGVTASIKLKDK